MERTTLYEDQAAYCTYLLRRPMSPARRALIEQERQDWLMLAYQDRLWSEIAAPEPANEPRRTALAEPQSFEV